MYLFDQLFINETYKAELWSLWIGKKTRIQGNVRTIYDHVHCEYAYTIAFEINVANEQKQPKKSVFLSFF
jgi:pyruvate/2-oxoacid:ferredoxin oxidoreductase beta subunit